MSLLGKREEFKGSKVTDCDADNTNSVLLLSLSVLTVEVSKS